MKNLLNQLVRVLLTLVVIAGLLPLNTARAAAPYRALNVNAAPVAVDDSGAGFTTDSDTPFITADVLANDSDPDGDPLTLSSYDAGAAIGLVTRVIIHAGALDPSFDGDGLQSTNFGFGDDNLINALLLQPDGKIVAGGNLYNGNDDDFALARYTPDGSLDSGFGENGLLDSDFDSYDETIYDLALQSDGKIVAVGSTYNGDDDDFVVARYSTDGALDTSFDTDGWATFDFGDYEAGYAVAVQPDGKIVIAGTAYNGDNYDFAVLRLLATGTLDTDFGVNGITLINFDDYSDTATDVLLQADNKIVVTGEAYNGVDFDFAVARLLATGTLDTDFSGDGMLATDFDGYDDNGERAALQTDGKIVLAGGTDNGNDSDFALARYNPDGSLDSSFGDSGLLTTDFGDYEWGTGVALQTDGKVVVVGTTELNGDYDFALARYNPNGSLDSGFGTGGLLTTDFDDGSNDAANAILIQPDGKIVAGGSLYNGNDYDFALARYLPNTNSTNTFSYDPNGMFIALKSGEVATDTFVYTVSDGALSATATVRITVNGINDAPTSNSQSLTTVEETPVGITLTGSDPEGDPLSGWTITSNPQHGALSGAAPNLTYTPALNFFGTDHFYFTVSDGSLTSEESEVTITVTNVNDAPLPADDGGSGFSTDEETAFITINILANDSDPDGDALQVSELNTSGTLGLVAATTSVGGALDPSFDGDGLVMTTYDTGNWEWAEGRAVAIQPDGKIVVGGTTNNKFTVARYNVDGSLDSSFGNGGKVITNTGGYATGEALLLQPDGKIVQGGVSNDKFMLARYTASGTLDTSFDGDGLLTTSFSDSSYIHGLALQEDGKIVAVGHIWMENGNDDFALARYNPDGSLDTTFSDDGKLTTDFSAASATTNSFDHARDAAIQPDGKIVVSGEAGYKFGLARYNADGTLDTTFSGDGLLATPVGSGSANATSVALQADGKIVAGGFATSPVTWSYTFAVARYNPDGSLDTGFGSSGRQLMEFGSYAISNGMALQSDGAIVLAGYTSSPDNFALARFTSTGMPDTSFDGDGKLTTHFPLYEKLFAVALQDDGKIVVAGTAYAGMQFNMALARYTPGGTMLNYDPNGQFESLGVGETAIDSLIYTLTDGIVSATATVRITIHGVNDAPVAADQSLTVPYNYTSTISLNASDIDGDVVTSTVVDAPLHGVAVGAGLNMLYTPATDYTGPDSFSYFINDGTLSSQIATVTLTIAIMNRPPIADSQSVSTAEEAAKAITLTASDLDSDPLSGWTIVSGPAHGALSGTAPNLTYTPALNYNGPDSFTFKVNDGQADSNLAVVNITVTPVNDDPVASAIANVDWLARTAHSYAIPAFTDVDGDPLTYTATIGGAALPAWLAIDPATGAFSGAPTNAEVGAYILLVTASDGHGGSATATFTLAVTLNPFMVFLPTIVR